MREGSTGRQAGVQGAILKEDGAPAMGIPVNDH
jgi:hypothetical protein